MTIEERNEIIEQCAQVVDQCNREGREQLNGAAVRIRAMKNDPMPQCFCLDNPLLRK